MYIYLSGRKQENQALMDGVVSRDSSSMTQIHNHNITPTAKRLRRRKKEERRKRKDR
jgi:hypothetical protein